jgi:hypothetical protein
MLDGKLWSKVGEVHVRCCSLRSDDQGLLPGLRGSFEFESSDRAKIRGAQVSKTPVELILEDGERMEIVLVGSEIAISGSKTNWTADFFVNSVSS